MVLEVSLLWTSKWKKKKGRRNVPKFIILSVAAVLVISLFHTWTMLKGPCQQTAATSYVGRDMLVDHSQQSAVSTLQNQESEYREQDMQRGVKAREK